MFAYYLFILIRLPGTRTLADFGLAGDSGGGAAADDDDDVDLFGSDDEVDEEAEKLKQERLKAYAEKKAKSNIFFMIIFRYIFEFYFIFFNRTWPDC